MLHPHSPSLALQYLGHSQSKRLIHNNDGNWPRMARIIIVVTESAVNNFVQFISFPSEVTTGSDCV
jgi:hypothetical protein